MFKAKKILAHRRSGRDYQYLTQMEDKENHKAEWNRLETLLTPMAQ